MTYLDLLRDADRQLDDGRITIGEYEQMIKPLECEVQPEVVRCGECKHFQCNMRFDGYVPKGADAYECRRGCGGCDPMDYCCYGERAERRTDE